MRMIFILIAFLFTQNVLAEVVKITGQDAQNICDILRDLNERQNDELLFYPLARVVKAKTINLAAYEYSIGNNDESITCATAFNSNVTTSSIATDVVRVLYNAEVTNFSRNRTLSDWKLFKAYDFSGALAENVCAQLESFNISEDQAALAPERQVLFTKPGGAVNIFGLLEVVGADKYMACGTISGVPTIQFESVNSF